MRTGKIIMDKNFEHLLCIKHYSKCFLCVSSCEPHKDPMKEYDYYSHFKDEGTEAQRSHLVKATVELFQILEDGAVKVLHSICQQFGKFSSGHRTGKGQFSFQSQRKAVPKNAQTTTQLHSSHTLVK